MGEKSLGLREGRQSVCVRGGRVREWSLGPHTLTRVEGCALKGWAGGPPQTFLGMGSERLAPFFRAPGPPGKTPCLRQPGFYNHPAEGEGQMLFRGDNFL